MNGTIFKGDFNHMIRAKRFQHGIETAQDIIDEVIQNETI